MSYKVLTIGDVSSIAGGLGTVRQYGRGAGLGTVRRYGRGGGLGAPVAKKPAKKPAVARDTDGTPVPGGVPPDGPKGGGAALVMCAVDTGKGGWRKVGGRWHYAHHKDLILSALAERYLGNGGMWKQIYNGSKERGLLPAGSTPDNIRVIDSEGNRVIFWMPDAAIQKAYDTGCIPDLGDGVAGSLGNKLKKAAPYIAGAAVLGGVLWYLSKD